MQGISGRTESTPTYQRDESNWPRLFAEVETEPPQAGAVIWCDGFVVLRRTENGNWIFPKGHVEPFERPREAAVREAQEETGLLVEPIEPLGYVEVQKRKGRIGLELYACRARGRGPAWPWHAGRDTFLVHPAAVASKLSFPELRRFWSEYLQHHHAAATA